MAKKKKKQKSPVQDRWRIDAMSMWDDDYLHEEVEAFIEFGDSAMGSFQFGYVQGMIDHRISERNGQPTVEFSWEGGDAADGTPLTGRGWAVLEDGELRGAIFIHQGDESEFVASKAKV